MPEQISYALQLAVACTSADCDNELDPAPDPRHIDNLRDAGWTCGQCRNALPQEPPC